MHCGKQFVVTCFLELALTCFNKPLKINILYFFCCYFPLQGVMCVLQCCSERIKQAKRIKERVPCCELTGGEKPKQCFNSFCNAHSGTENAQKVHSESLYSTQVICCQYSSNVKKGRFPTCWESQVKACIRDEERDRWKCTCVLSCRAAASNSG